ncbi:xanthine dehydrogenase accessory protein XdhC [Streptomyces sp. NPDC005708]|uniref:xanthine dehydrogenase accessory protein XdhC n=1 Tax=Streptomyces sp. NPDC005708 TaxID=3154564 RepID=UPI0033CA0C52
MPDMDWVEAVTRTRHDGRSAVLVTVSRVRGHAPREAGAKMVVTADASFGSIGGGNLEATVIDRAREMLADGSHTPEMVEMALNEHVRTRHGRQCCGGELAVFLEPLPARPTVAVFGVGHVGLELGRLLARHPLLVHLVDSRPGQLEGAKQLAGQVADIHTHAAPIPETALTSLPAGAHVYIMTHDHAEDFALCDAALRRGDLGSIGLIGSAAKWARFRKGLTEGGHKPAAVDTITCPIGLPGLFGKSPAVIAVSVVAELLTRLEADVASPNHVADLDAVVQ